MEKEVKLFIPGRLGIIGELSDLVTNHLDENKELIEGHAIAMPLKIGIYSISKKSDKLIYKNINLNQYLELEPTNKNLLKEINNNTFYSYICGTIYCLKKLYQVKGINIEITKMNLPIKKGLSSSASICISIIKAYNKLYNLNLKDEEIKNIAQKGEHKAKSKCGKLDQEAIMMPNISHLIFKKDKTEIIPIKLKKHIPILIVDLKGNKNTKYIMKKFNHYLPLPKNQTNYHLHEIVGQKNKQLVNNCIIALETGNIEKLGQYINEAQKLLDNASSICKQFISPKFHLLSKDGIIKNLTYGIKSIGSGGDGTALLIPKGTKEQKILKEYIKNVYNMNAIELEI